MSRVSALVVVHNEEQILSACLSRLGFADEIVVVLDRCADKSAEIAERHGARTLSGAWPLEGERRRAGIAACDGPWILEIDADEWVEASLAAEIRTVVDADDADFCFTPIHNYVGERWVKYGWMASLAPDLRGSLFRKGHKVWGDQLVHPQVDFSGRRGADLMHGVRHNFVADSRELMLRFNRNTSLRAEELVQNRAHARTRTMVRKAISRFWKCYVARKGRREGRIGLLISILSALYPLVAHLKAEEIRSRQVSSSEHH